MSLDNLNLQLIEKASKHKGSLIAAIIEYADENDIPEFESITDHLDPILKQRLKDEFIAKKFFPGKKIEGSLEEFFT